MDTVVIYESMWGNTADVARAIAAGLGDGVLALTTEAATPELIADARLIVAGAPVHGLNLPTDGTRATAAKKTEGKPGPHADVSGPSMRSWLEALPAGERYCAAFDTGVRGPLGHGAAPAIMTRMEALGYTAIDEPKTFTVALITRINKTGALLLPGQEEKAFAWGAKLASLMRATAPVDGAAQ